MEVTILKNVKLIDGELFYDQEILLGNVETFYLDYKPINKEVTILYTLKGKKYGLFDSDVIVLDENDTINIKE